MSWKNWRSINLEVSRRNVGATLAVALLTRGCPGLGQAQPLHIHGGRRLGDGVALMTRIKVTFRGILHYDMKHMFIIASIPQQEQHGTSPHYIIIAPGRRVGIRMGSHAGNRFCLG
jgi:hypothetical protein